MDTKEVLRNVVDYLNSHYNQDSEDYCIIRGARPDTFKCGEHVAVSLWVCGAIVCIGDILYFIQEDDGYWFLDESGEAVQDNFSIGWAKSFIEALERLMDFVKENGEPVYFSGIEKKIVCHYRM
jgi:hypothetical protein